MTEQSENNPITEQEAMEQWKAVCMVWCRKERDKALAETDYVHLPDVTVSDEYMASITSYRQELRDFPATWSVLFDEMTEEQKHGVTNLSIREVMPVKPE